MASRQAIEKVRNTPKGLTEMARELGYQDTDEFFEDNPGAVDAIIGFVLDHGKDRDGIALEDDTDYDTDEVSEDRDALMGSAVEHVGLITGGDFSVLDGYSGRGMFGKVSSFAITTSYHPNSPQGVGLRNLGLTYDNLGFDFIYYKKD